MASSLTGQLPEEPELLHTLYVDKPMHGHSMIQAISRVNRVFRDKPEGLVVDYIGIGDQLREATAKYTRGGDKGEPAKDLEEEARPLFLLCLDKRSISGYCVGLIALACSYFAVGLGGQRSLSRQVPPVHVRLPLRQYPTQQERRRHVARLRKR